MAGLITLLRTLLGFLPILKWLGPAAIIAFASNFGWSVVSNYRDMQATITSQKRDLALRDSREAALRRGNDRRDAAIAASQCAAQIQKWIRNPDDIPTKFDPFNQLENPGKGYRP